MAKPTPGTYASFYEGYINQVKADSIAVAIETYSRSIHEFIQNLPEEKAQYAYAPGKWTVNDVLQHMIDTERVFVYRAMRFSRNDATPLPGFEEDHYAMHAGGRTRPMDVLKEEFTALRKSTDLFLLSLTDEQLQRSGMANHYNTQVNAIAFMVYGHLLHHRQVLEERYL
jgi:uncharacterized damage-inducible protein DinB